MRRSAWDALVWIALGWAASAAPAQAIDCDAVPPATTRLEAQRYVVLYRMVPTQPPLSTHFSLDVAVCPKAGVPAAPGLAVDARMPAHDHGMNYKTTVKRVGAASFRVDGLLFHMPGRWQLMFDVGAGSTVERVTHDVTL